MYKRQDYKVYAISWDREKLYDRINQRVDIMIDQGLIEEVRKIYSKYKKISYIYLLNIEN